MHIPPTVADEIPSKFKDAQQSIASFYKFINKFPEHQQIFTDASACAVCTPEEKLQFKLSNTFSVMSSEAYAIL